MIRQAALRSLFLISAVSVLGASVHLAWQPDTRIEELLTTPNILTTLANQAKTAQDTGPAESILVQQARRFGLHLDPPPKPNATRSVKTHLATARLQSESAQEKISKTPKSASPKFQVLATSVYSSNPGKSMALIVEAGTDSRWVKAGELVGHILIEDICSGSVVWRHGSHTEQLAVTTKPQKGKEDLPERLIATNRHVGFHRLAAKENLNLPPPPVAKPKPIVRGLRVRR